MIHSAITPFLTRIAAFAAFAVAFQSSAIAESHHHKTNPTKARTIYVKLSKVEQAQALASVKSLGTVIAKNGNVLTVTVKSGVAVNEAIAKLRKVRSISEAWQVDAPLLKPQILGTVSGIKAELKKFAKDDDDNDHYQLGKSKPAKRLTPEQESESNPDYLRALLYFTERRAYPYDRIDWDAYKNAVAHAAAMPSAGGSSSATTASGLVRTAATVASPAPVSNKWTYIGPNNLDVPYTIYYGTRPTSGRIGAVAFDPQNANTYYMGGSAGGLWKTTDGGTTWTALGDKWPALPVSSIAVTPTNSKIVYVGTGDFEGGVGLTNGIMKTTDGGATWTAIGTAQFGNSDVSGILIDPETPTTLTISTCFGPAGGGQIWRSTNSGQTWTQVLTVQAQWTSITTSIADSTGKRTYYVGAGGNPGLIYSSTDRGQTWTKLTSPFSSQITGMDVAASAVDAATIYAFGPDAQKLFKSTNSGSSWTDITGNLVTSSSYNFSQSWYDYWFNVIKNGTSDDLLIGLIDIAESTNGGTNWTFVGQTFTNNAITHNDQHCFAVNPSNPNQFLFGNDGGVYLANRTSSTAAWTIKGLSKNVGVTMFYHGVFDPSDATKMIGGTQDNATPVSTGDLANWANVGGGDGGFVAVNPSNRLMQYCTIYDLTVINTTDGWQTQNGISPNTSGDPNLPFVTPIYNDPVNTKYLYALSDYLYRWDSQAQTWTNRLGGIMLSHGSLIHALAVAPTDGNTIYTGSDDGQLFMSKDGGNTFTNITNSSLPNRSITSISVDKTNPHSILIGLSGSGTGHLYQCVNTLAATPAFTSVAGSGVTGLPDASLNCIEREIKSQATMWYVGTDIGVFYTRDAGKTWTNATNSLGLPIVQITAIQETLYSTLNVATYGRGMWKLPLAALAGGSASFGTAPYALQSYEGTFVPSQPTATNGVITQLAKDDGTVVTVSSVFDTVSQSQLAGFEADFNAGAGTLQSLSFAITASVNVPSTIQVYIYNLSTGKYDLLGQNPSSTSLTNVTYTVTKNYSQYMDSTGKIRALIRSVTPGRQNTGTVVLKVDSFLANAIVG